MKEKIEQLELQTEQLVFVAFEPFSPIVVKKLAERRELKSKLLLFNDILSDKGAYIISETEKAKVVIFPNHKGIQHETWQGIVQMAKDINAHGESVIFLPEYTNETSADALVLFKGVPTIADFKYCVTTKSNTLASDLTKGFLQAKTIVLKLENMDVGEFKCAVDYLLRNEISYGNIKLINKYGRMLELSYTDIRKGKYGKMIKGFLK